MTSARSETAPCGPSSPHSSSASRLWQFASMGSSERQPSRLVSVLNRELEPDLTRPVRHLNPPVQSTPAVGITAREQSVSGFERLDRSQVVAAQDRTHAILLAAVIVDNVEEIPRHGWPRSAQQPPRSCPE